jgi:hypothetical protein
VNLTEEHKVFLDVIQNCPIDCLAKPNDKIPAVGRQREILKSDFNQIFYRLKKEGVSRFPYETLPMDFRWNLCSTRLRMGHFDNWDGWEFRGSFSTTFHRLRFPTPKWMGEEVNEGGLKVCGEQGIGDEIMFLSCLPDLMYRVGPKVIEINCYPRLIPIVERSFKVKCVPRPKGLSDVDGGAMILMGDLLRWYRKGGGFPKKPYLKPDPEGIEFWTKELQKLGNKKKIGIAWRSRHGTLNPKDLLSENGIYVCLQYGLTPEDLEFCHSNNVHMVDTDPTVDMENHMALIAALDKIVTVTQTVVHVAGAIGKKCHAIIPPRGTGEVDNRLWYYGTGGPHYVYGSVTVYPSIRDWSQTT